MFPIKKQFLQVFAFTLILALQLSPFSSIFQKDSIFFSISIYCLYYISFLGLIYIGIYLIQVKETLIFSLSKIEIGLLMFLTVVFCSLFFSGTFSFKNEAFLKIISFVIIYIFLKKINLDDKSKVFFVLTVSAINTILNCHALLQYFNIIANETVFSMGSVFKNPSIFTNYLSCTLPFSLIFFVDKRIRENKLLLTISIVSLLLSVLVIIISKERTAWLASFVTLIVFFKAAFHENLFSKTKREYFRIFIVGCSILMICCLPLLISMRPTSVNGRLFIYQNTLNIIEDHLWFGVGYDKFKAIYHLYQSEYFLNHPQSAYASIADDIKVPFNEFLKILSELGIIGLSAIVFILIVLAKNIRKTSKYRESTMEIIASTGLCSIFICSIFSYPLNTILILFYLMLFIRILDRSIVFTIPVNLKWKTVLALPCFILSFFLIGQVTEIIKNTFKWKRAATRNFNIATYRQLNEHLNTNGHFMYNYGVTLIQNGYYIEGIDILKKASQIFGNTDIYVYLGDAYKAINQYSQAEKSYLLATRMVPKKFIPKYALMQFYVDMKNTKKANHYAEEILNTPIITESFEVKEIKKQALEIYKISVH